MSRRLTVVLSLLLSAPALAGDPPTFHRDIEPIVQRRCQDCHRPGGIGPFELMTYEDVAGDLPTISEVLGERRMPPWHADPAVGHFSNSRALTDAELATFSAWIEHGAPEGDPAHAPAPRTFPAEWTNGTPDAIVQIPREVKIPAAGTLDYQYFNVPTDFGEDKWVKAMEVRVGAPTVVHHVLVFIRYPAGAGPSPRVNGGLDGYFASALPGDQVLPFPRGTAKRLPRGSTLTFQIHYTPDGEARTDLTRMALYFAPADEPITREAQSVSLHTERFAIPPGAKGHEVRARHEFRQDTIIHGLLPHMHVRGETFRYLLMYPDGSHRPVLSIPRWDFNWQNTYVLAEPLFVPKGAKMMGIATYDNSADNPANPDPTATVFFGEQTWDEMMIGYMDVVAATPEERAAWERSHAEQVVTPLDPPPPGQ